MSDACARRRYAGRGPQRTAPLPVAARIGGTDSEEPTDLLGRSLILQTWLSAAFPTGAFSFSHGLEAAIAQQRIGCAGDLETWLVDILHHGSLHNDAVLLSAAWHAAGVNDVDRLADLNALSLALMAGAERLRESLDQGAAWCAATRPWCAGVYELLRCDRGTLSLPVAVGISMAAVSMPLALALGGWMQAFLGNLVWIAVRLVPLGQQQGLSLIAGLQGAVEGRAQALAVLESGQLLDCIGGCAVLADIAAMQHEQLPTRLCLS